MPRVGNTKVGDTVASRLKATGARLTKKASEPFWKGPESDSPQGGVTQSMLGRFLACRERFKVRVIDGLDRSEGFSQRLEYGNMWHVCEEALAGDVASPFATYPWEHPLKKYCQTLCRRYPLQQQQVEHWYNVCKVQFPLYANWWKKHPDVLARTPIFQEETFNVPYVLPSGRVVRLRGKFDAVDLIGKGKNAGVYLQENKTKGDIDAPLLKKMLESGFELQTMFYLIALTEYSRSDSNPDRLKIWNKPVNGVRYNVVRRPLSGGRGSIKQREATQGSKCPKCKGEGSCVVKKTNETIVCPKCAGAKRIGAKAGEASADFYARLSGIIEGDIEPNGDHYYFMRWKTEVSESDIERFKKECLDPILEQLCNWYDCQVGKVLPPYAYRPEQLHYRFPYGVYNPIAEGLMGDIDDYLNTGNEVGLQKIETLFPELDC